VTAARKYNDFRNNKMKKELKKYQSSDISHEMISSIVSLAATGVNGVEGLSMKITDEIMDKLSLASTIKGVKVSQEPEGLMIGVYLITEPRVDIVRVSREVQTKVKASVESMTGLQVTSVNIRIEGSGI